MKEETAYWLEQAAYDLETARAMFRTCRYVYVIFMCHLCLEKTLKGCVSEYTNVFPPRTHNLTSLLALSGIKLPEEMRDFVFKLAGQSVPTRYPKDLKIFTRPQAHDYLQQTERTFSWLQRELTSSE